MSSIDIKTGQAAFKAETEAEMLVMMAKAYGCRLIYKYANDYGDKTTLTDYKVIISPGDAQEQAFLNSPKVHNAVLVFKDGKEVHEPLERPLADEELFSALPIPTGVPLTTVQAAAPVTGTQVPPAVGKLDLGGNKIFRASSSSSKTAVDLKKDLRGWGIGMIIWGLLSFIFPRYLDPVWGGIIVVLGIVNLLAINRVMFIINGLALIVVGGLNIASVISVILTSGISSFWLAYGFLQIGWGFQEIIKFDKFSPMREFSTYPVGLSGAVGRFTAIPMKRSQVENASIVNRQAFDQHLERIARLWINEDKPSRAELMISGYDNDPRELYEIPEVCAWARRVVNESPVLPYFLTSTSLDRFTAWLCGPLSKNEIATREFEQRFLQTRAKIYDIAFQGAAPYLQRMGAGKNDLSKINSQINNSQNEAVKIGSDGHAYTAAVLSKNEMRKYRKLLPRMVTRQYPWTIFAGVIMGILLFGGIFFAVFWASNHFPRPSMVNPLNNTPAHFNSQNSSDQICWTKEITGFDGNRSQVWEQYLDEPTRRLLTFDSFKTEVVNYNPILKTEGYVFFSQKTYVLPEVCP